MKAGDKIAVSTPSRWPNGTTVYIEGEVVELRAGGKVVAFRDSAGCLGYAKRHLVKLCEATRSLGDPDEKEGEDG